MSLSVLQVELNREQAITHTCGVDVLHATRSCSRLLRLSAGTPQLQEGSLNAMPQPETTDISEGPQAGQDLTDSDSQARLRLRGPSPGPLVLHQVPTIQF